MAFLYSHNETPDSLFEGLRRANALRTQRVEEAMRAVNRAHYIRHNPWTDSPQSIGHGQTISAPHMHAMCLELLAPHIKDGSHVLDVGSGTGILTAALALLAGQSGKVIGIDVVPELVETSIENVKRDQPELLSSGRVVLKVQDGWKGDAENAPYDAIHVGAAAASVPRALVEQLARGGRMVIPVGPEGGEQYLMQLDKDTDGKVSETVLFGVRYVPLVNRERAHRD